MAELRQRRVAQFPPSAAGDRTHRDRDRLEWQVVGILEGCHADDVTLRNGDGVDEAGIVDSAGLGDEGPIRRDDRQRQDAQCPDRRRPDLLRDRGEGFVDPHVGDPATAGGDLGVEVRAVDRADAAARDHSDHTEQQDLNREMPSAVLPPPDRTTSLRPRHVARVDHVEDGSDRFGADGLRRGRGVTLDMAG